MRLYRLFYLAIQPQHAASLLLMLFMTHVAVAQSFQEDEIIYGFKQDTVQSKAGETFSNFFWVENRSDRSIVLYPETKQGLLPLPDTLLLAADEKRFLPLKYIADRQTIKKSVQDIEVRLRSPKQDLAIQKSAIFYVLLQEIQGLILDVDQQEIYLDQLTNQASVMIRCFNNGLVPVDFQLELSEIPEGLEFIGETMTLRLQPGEQQSLPFLAKNTLSRKTLADFAVTVRALDVQHQQLAVKRLRIMSVSSDRRLALSQSPFYQQKTNTLALRYMNVDKSLSMYQLQGNGRYALPNQQRLNYQLNIDYFENRQKGFNVYDSYVDYQSEDWGVKIGNIYEVIDFNLNGRGFKTTAHLDNKRTIHVYGLDNSFLLFSQFNTQKLGNTFAVNYKEDSGSLGRKNLVLLRNTNLLTATNTTLLSGAIFTQLDANQGLGLEGGFSVQDGHHNEMISANGAALGINYNLNGKFINFYSNNYYATPYYGGIRKGLLQLDNKVSARLNLSQTLSARISLMENKPKLLATTESNVLPVTNNYGNSIYELGYGTQIGKWGLHTMPYYFTQYMEVGDSFDEKNKWQSASIRTKVNLAYSNAYHDLSFDVDNGYTFQNTSQEPPAPFFSSRIHANYRNQIAGLSAFVQFNSYFLSDALAVSNNPKYTIYSLGPNTQFALLSGNLTVNAQAMYNYFGYSRSHNYSFNGNVRWLLKEGWSVSTDIFYGLSRQKMYEYNPMVGYVSQEQLQQQNNHLTYSNRQIRIGIEKSFGSSQQTEERKLELTYFEDRNGNGYREKDEPLVSGILVKMDGIAAITNEKGTVKFTAIKDRNYVIAMVSNTGWITTEQTEIFLSSHRKIAVPLVKTAHLTGEIEDISDKYVGTSGELAGIRIHAVSESGGAFTTLTNEKGIFNFYLPENEYTVYIDTEGMPFTIENPKERVVVQGKQSAELRFQYKDASRKVEVTKFR